MNQQILKLLITIFLLSNSSLFITRLASAIVINSNTTWTNPSILNDSLIINSGITLTIRNSNGIDGGDLQINLPNQGFFQILNGGILNLNATGLNGRGGDLTVRLTGASGNIDIAGLIFSNGGGIGRAGIISLNGSSFNLANTGQIIATSALGLGGKVLLENSNGPITLENGFQIQTNGLSDSKHNLIEITGAGVNIDGTLTANGINSGSAGGIIRISSNGTTSNVHINNRLLSTGTLGANGGSIRINSNQDIHLGSNAILAASSGSSGVNSGNGGVVDLNAGRHITISSNNGGYSINVNASENPTVLSGNGRGGNVFLSAEAGDISLFQNSGGNRGVIEANGAIGGTGDAGEIRFKKARDIMITNTGTKRITLSARGGVTTGSVGGNGGLIKFGGGENDEGISRNITIDNSIIRTLAGNVNRDAIGHGGEIAIQLDGDFSVTNTTIQTMGAGGNPLNQLNNGKMSLISTQGNITLSDPNSNFLMWSNGNSIMKISANNINNAGLLANRAARSSSNANPNGGGNLEISATGSIINTGEINASAWTPRLDYIPTNEESTGSGGNIIIQANSMDNQGKIHAYGGLNTQSSTQGLGGSVAIQVENSFTQNNNGNIDSRGTANTNEKNKISISAGSIDLNGQINASGFYANEGGGLVELNSTAGDMTIQSGALINTSGGLNDVFNNKGPGGNIQIKANNSGAVTIAGAVQATGQNEFAGGKINIEASGNIILDNGASLDSRGNDESDEISLSSSEGTILLFDDVNTTGKLSIDAPLGSVDLSDLPPGLRFLFSLFVSLREKKPQLIHPYYRRLSRQVSKREAKKYTHKNW